MKSSLFLRFKKAVTSFVFSLLYPGLFFRGFNKRKKKLDQSLYYMKLYEYKLLINEEVCFHEKLFSRSSHEAMDKFISLLKFVVRFAKLNSDAIARDELLYREIVEAYEEILTATYNLSFIENTDTSALMDSVNKQWDNFYGIMDYLNLKKIYSEIANPQTDV